MVAVGALKHCEYNPRRLSAHDYKTIKESIETFGFVENIVVNSAPDREGIIIGGNQRFEVAKKLGHKEVPVFYVNIPDLQKEKELSIRLNHASGEWDFDLLANTFEEEDLLSWGFKEEELGLELSANGSELNSTKKTFAICPECSHEFEIQVKRRGKILHDGD